MHVEAQKRRGKTYYYLAHSFRDGGRVRKARKYLGADLSSEEIQERRTSAENALREQAESDMRVGDPLHAALPLEEKERMEALISWHNVQPGSLSEGQWLRFTEHFAYDTNAIEGSTLRAREVKGIIEEDRWPDALKDEIAETYGVADAVKHIRETGEHLSISLIKRLHRMVFRNSKPYAGMLRGPEVEVVIADRRGIIVHRGSPQRKVVGSLRRLVAWYGENIGSYHPIVLAAAVHNQFECIHPFRDGNGRIGRLLMNNILLRHGMRPVNIEFKNREGYYSALQAYQREGDIRPTVELMLKEHRRLGRMLKNN